MDTTQQTAKREDAMKLTRLKNLTPEQRAKLAKDNIKLSESLKAGPDDFDFDALHGEALIEMEWEQRGGSK